MSQTKIGKPAPSFKCVSVVNGEFKEISLADYKGKYVVLFFYPMDLYALFFSIDAYFYTFNVKIYLYLSTFVCPTEIVSFSDRVEEFRTIGCEVIGASTDSEFSHLAWINTPRKQGKID